MKEIKKLYMFRIEKPGEDFQDRTFVLDRPISSLPKEIIENTKSVARLDWYYAEADDADGDFFMLTAQYYDEVLCNLEPITYLVKAPDIGKAVDIVQDEIGPSYRDLMGIEKFEVEVTLV